MIVCGAGHYGSASTNVRLVSVSRRLTELTEFIQATKLFDRRSTISDKRRTKTKKKTVNSNYKGDDAFETMRKYDFCRFRS